MNIADLIAALQANQDPDKAVIQASMPGVAGVSPQQTAALTPDTPSPDAAPGPMTALPPIPYFNPARNAPAAASPAPVAAAGPPTGARTPVTNPQPAGQSPTTIQSPPDLANMYVKLMEKNQNAAALDSGLTLMAAGLSNNLTTRAALIQNAASGGGGRGAGGITSADIINLTKQQQEMKNNLLRQSMLGGLAKQYNLSPETIQYLEASGKLDEVIKHKNTQDLLLVEDKVDGSAAFHSKIDGRKIIDVRGPQAPGEKVHEFDDQLATINKERTAAGQPPMTMEQYIQTKKPAGTTVNIGPDGIAHPTPPPGFDYKRKIGPDGKPQLEYDERGLPIQLPINIKTSQEIEKQKHELDAKGKEQEKVDIAKGKEAIQTVFKAHSVGKAIQGALEYSYKPGATGFFSRVARGLPIGGEEAPWTDMDSFLKTIDANTAFDALKQMRDASPTGASGLGQVTDVEQQMLKSVIANLTPHGNPDVLREKLIRVNVAMHLLAGDDFGAKTDPKGAQARFVQALDQGVAEALAAEKAKRGGADPGFSGIRPKGR